MYDVISPSSLEIKTALMSDASLQRSRGVLDLKFSLRDGHSYAARTYQQGALKVRFPNKTSGVAPEAVVLNTSGGIAGADKLDICIEMEADTKAAFSTQACEKIYRSLGEPANVFVTFKLHARSSVAWLPQPMIFFDGACLQRETRVVMSSDAIWLSVEGIIFGRAAMGESVQTGSLDDACLVYRDGRLIHVDRFRVQDEIGRMLDKKTVLDGQHVMATTRYIAPDAESRIDEMREILAPSSCAAAVSAWDGMMIVRHVAPDSYTLNREIVRVLTAFQQAAMPRVWSI